MREKSSEHRAEHSERRAERSEQWEAGGGASSPEREHVLPRRPLPKAKRVLLATALLTANDIRNTADRCS